MIDRKTVYFAHPITHYNTDFEWECMDVILNMLTPVGEDITEGHVVITNPNQKWISDLYKSRKELGHPNPFGFFEEMAEAHDIIVGCTFFDGSVGSGVAKEMKTGLEKGKDVFMIFVCDGIKLFLPVSNMDLHKVLSLEETREKIKKGMM